MTKKTQKKFDFQSLNVDVISAASLDEIQKNEIITLLEDALNGCKVVLNEKINADLVGGFQVQIGSVLIDLSVRNKLKLLQTSLDELDFQEINVNMFEKQLSSWEKQKKLTARIQKIGKVVSVKDGIVRVCGMKDVKASELIEFESGERGIVFTLNTEYADVVLLTQATDLKEGMIAFQTGQTVRVPVGKQMIGRVVNALGEPIDGRGKINSKLEMPLESPVPGIIDRQPVFRPFQTGVKVIDALVPIGLGQRELIVGDRQTGKTSILIDAILSQKRLNDKVEREKDKIYCIYVCIGQKQSTVAEVVQILQNTGAMDYTCVVCANASDCAAQQYLAPFTGTTIAEYFRDNGMNAVIFYDDLSKHANAYRQISLLLRRPPGREAYPGDVFYLHSRLLERAAMMSEKKGGGSLTALPVVETQEGDLSAYIPTNVISITDGQIFLESTLFNQGVRPAVNVGLSVSRVGSKAQRPLLAKLSGSMKLELAQYREMLSFAQIASDLDTSTQDLLQKGMRMTESLKQRLYKPLSFVDEYISLYAVSKGFYRSMNVSDICALESFLLQNMHENYSEVIDEIDAATDILSENVIHQLDNAIKDSITSFIEQEVQEKE